MIVSDIITRVRRSFGDEAAVQVTDADVMRWINDAMIELVKANDQALQKTDYIDLVINQSVYVLPTDLLQLRALRYKFSSMVSFQTLRYKNMQEFDDYVDGWDGTLYSASNPTFFTMEEGKAILFPTPNESVVDGLKVVYNYTPATVTTSMDSLSLPLRYHPTVVKYCLWQASLLDDDNEPAIMHQSNFASDVQQLMGLEVRDPVATYSTITVLAEDQ